MAFTITAGPRGLPAVLGVSHRSFSEALEAALAYYDQGYQVEIRDQTTQEVFTETQVLQARDRLRKATASA